MDQGPTLLIVSVCVLAVVLIWARSRQARRDGAQAQRDLAAQSRLLRLSADALRGPTLALLGHADRLGEPPLRVLGLELLGLADDLQDRAHRLHPPSIKLEALALKPSIEAAVAAVDAMMGPTHRHWRVAAGFDGLMINADRRALHEIMVRVLTNAARCSGEGDWIELFPQNRVDGFSIVVEDEGTGLARPEPPVLEGVPDSRGIGLGLSLARTLLEAQGGRLVIESMMRVGTRVSVSFPVEAIAKAQPPVKQLEVSVR